MSGQDDEVLADLVFRIRGQCTDEGISILRDFLGTSGLPMRLRGDGPCSDCGADQNIVWFTESVFWNHVVRTEPSRWAEREPILCIPCFVKATDEMGYQPTGWRLLPEWPWRRAATTEGILKAEGTEPIGSPESGSSKGEEDGVTGSERSVRIHTGVDFGAGESFSAKGETPPRCPRRKCSHCGTSTCGSEFGECPDKCSDNDRGGLMRDGRWACSGECFDALAAPAEPPTPDGVAEAKEKV